MNKFMNRLMKAIEWIIAFLLFASVVIVLAQVIWRYALRRPLSWSDQMCRFIYVWIVMLGIPLIFHRKAVTAFDFLTSKLSRRGQDGMYVFVCVLAMFFAAAFFVFSLQFIGKKGGQLIPGFGIIPYTAVYASQPVSCVLLFIVMLNQFIQTVHGFGKKKEADE